MVDRESFHGARTGASRGTAHQSIPVSACSRNHLADLAWLSWLCLTECSVRGRSGWCSDDSSAESVGNPHQQSLLRLGQLETWDRGYREGLNKFCSPMSDHFRYFPAGGIWHGLCRRGASLLHPGYGRQLFAHFHFGFRYCPQHPSANWT